MPIKPSEPAVAVLPSQPGAVHDRVYRTLRSRIMFGEILPGVSMTLRGLGEEFGWPHCGP
jgi:DNA-binding GntR family transcriptional regulator